MVKVSEANIPSRDTLRNNNIEEIRKKAQRKANIFFEVFDNPVGKEVLAEIKAQFDPPVLADGNTATIIRAAQRDVVRWIEDVINRGNKHD